LENEKDMEEKKTGAHRGTTGARGSQRERKEDQKREREGERMGEATGAINGGTIKKNKGG
jgi:hypothetical protein